MTQSQAQMLLDMLRSASPDATGFGPSGCTIAVNDVDDSASFAALAVLLEAESDSVRANAPWLQRLHKFVERMEKQYAPDVVILDSRAGLHDIAAVLATRMEAVTLLFAIDTPQTWRGYELLFKHWRSHPHLTTFRTNLQVIAGMVPDTGRDAYLQGFKEHAWDIFRDNLYDVTGPDDLDTFSFDLDDESAPHAPVPIFCYRALMEFDPSKGGIDRNTAEEAFSLFFEQADRLLATTDQD